MTFQTTEQAVLKRSGGGTDDVVVKKDALRNSFPPFIDGMCI